LIKFHGFQKIVFDYDFVWIRFTPMNSSTINIPQASQWLTLPEPTFHLVTVGSFAIYMLFKG